MDQNPRRSLLSPGILLLLALLSGGWFLQRGVAQEQNVYVQSRLFQEVLDLVANRYVDEVDRNSLYEFAIEGMLSELGDPNTTLLTADRYEDFRIQTEGDYGGVGLEIVERDDYITVVSPIPGGPGIRAGIRAGDEIVEVDGVSTEGWSSQEAVQVLRGRPGTETTVGIRRGGMDETIHFTLTREQIQLRSVPFYSLLEGDVGYIPLSVFSEGSTREVRMAAEALVARGARSLILDLRGNPGGILEQGIGITDLFLDSGLPVAETRGRARDQNTNLRSSSPDMFASVNLAVLVDRGSASASEIVAGALQDHDRALVLGGSTFGKGSVQSLLTLTGGNVLKLTTARWFTPRGRSIERVAPLGDEEGEMDPTEAPELTLTVLGGYRVAPDTAGRPTLASFAGRTLYGGGGIVPDLLVSADTLSTDEQAAVRALFREGGRYSVGMFNYAADYLRRMGTERTDFQVSEADLDRLFDQLQASGLTVDRATWDRARRFVRATLENEIALQGWGDEAAFLRGLSLDAPVRRAAELLRGASSRDELFARGGTPIPAQGAAGEN